MLNLLYKQELEEIVMNYEAHRNKLQREIEEKVLSFSSISLCNLFR